MMTQTCKRKSGSAKTEKCCAGIEQFLSPKFFKALCDPSRIALLSRLTQSREALSVSEVAECCTIDISVVSRHLAILRDVGIVMGHKIGKEMFYEIDYGFLVQTLRRMADSIETCCPPKTRKGAKK